MSENRKIDEVAVDRRDETLVTRQPGYASTAQTTRDAAAERRLGFQQATRIIWTILGVLEILLGLRFLLKLIAANADAGFARFIYGITKPFISPFALLVGTPTSGGTIFETTTLIAMLVYALLFWVIVRIIRVAADRPSARTVTTSVHEQTQTGSDSGSGTDRTAHTFSRK